MTAAFTIVPRGPFSLAQAREFLRSFRPAGQPTGGDRFDLVVEGAVVRLREDGGMDPEDAMAAMRELPGIGPFSSALIVIRGVGAADAPATSEPRVRAVTAERYDDPALEEPDAFAAFAERWRPWRSWAASVLRAA